MIGTILSTIGSAVGGQMLSSLLGKGSSVNIFDDLLAAFTGGNDDAAKTASKDAHGSSAKGPTPEAASELDQIGKLLSGLSAPQVRVEMEEDTASLFSDAGSRAIVDKMLAGQEISGLDALNKPRR